MFPVSHRLFESQQPWGHEDTLQTQAPSEQICPATQGAWPPQVQAPDAEHPSPEVPHEAQLAPPVPHAVDDGEVQILPWQHPSGQDEALHTHAPPTQACPAPHAPVDPHEHLPPTQPLVVAELQVLQADPPLPHSDSDGDVTHVVPSQHPPGHEVALQTQVPPEHT